MIRFSAALVVVAIGILVGGVATSRLSLVYVAIAVSAAALVVLAIGVVLKRKELFGEQPQKPADAGAADLAAGATIGQPALVGQAAAGAGRDWPVWDADSRPAQSGARATGTDVQAGAWYQEPDQATPWRMPARPDAPSRGRHAGPVVSSPAASAPPAPPAPAPPAPTPPAPAPSAPPTEPVRQVQSAASDWPPPPSPPSGPDRPLPRSWFDKSAHAEPPADGNEAPTESAPATSASKAPATDTPKSDVTDDSAADYAVDDTATADDSAADDSAADDSAGADAETATDSGPEPSQANVNGEANADIEDPDSPRDDLKHVTVVPGVPRYHNANCILIRFMGEDDLQKMSVSEATAAGCTPCRACQPDSATE